MHHWATGPLQTFLRDWLVAHMSVSLSVLAMLRDHGLSLHPPRISFFFIRPPLSARGFDADKSRRT